MDAPKKIVRADLGIAVIFSKKTVLEKRITAQVRTSIQASMDKWALGAASHLLRAPPLDYRELKTLQAPQIAVPPLQPSPSPPPSAGPPASAPALKHAQVSLDDLPENEGPPPPPPPVDNTRTSPSPSIMHSPTKSPGVTGSTSLLIGRVPREKSALTLQVDFSSHDHRAGVALSRDSLNLARKSIELEGSPGASALLRKSRDSRGRIDSTALAAENNNGTSGEEPRDLWNKQRRNSGRGMVQVSLHASLLGTSSSSSSSRCMPLLCRSNRSAVLQQPPVAAGQEPPKRGSPQQQKGVSFVHPVVKQEVAPPPAHPHKSPLLKGRFKSSRSSSTTGLSSPSSVSNSSSGSGSGTGGSGSSYTSSVQSSNGYNSSANTSVRSVMDVYSDSSMPPSPPSLVSPQQSGSPDSVMAAPQATATTASSEPERGYTTPLRPSQSRARSSSNSRANFTGSQNGGHLAGQSTDVRSSRGGAGVGGGASAARLSRDFTERNGSGQAVYPGSARAGAAAKKKAKEKERKARERERRIQANAKHFAKLEFEEMERHKREAHHAHHDAKKASSGPHGRSSHTSNGINSLGGGSSGLGDSLDYGNRYGHGHGSASSDNGEPTPFNYKQLGGAALGGFMVGGPVGAFAGAGAALLWDREMREREKKRAMVELQERRLKRLSRQSFNQNESASESASSTPTGHGHKHSSGGGDLHSGDGASHGDGGGRKWLRFRAQAKQSAPDASPSSEAELMNSPGPAASASETIEQVLCSL